MSLCAAFGPPLLVQVDAPWLKSRSYTFKHKRIYPPPSGKTGGSNPKKSAPTASSISNVGVGTCPAAKSLGVQGKLPNGRLHKLARG
jgi:hypothetical protein